MQWLIPKNIEECEVKRWVRSLTVFFLRKYRIYGANFFEICESDDGYFLLPEQIYLSYQLGTMKNDDFQRKHSTTK